MKLKEIKYVHPIQHNELCIYRNRIQSQANGCTKTNMLQHSTHITYVLFNKQNLYIYNLNDVIRNKFKLYCPEAKKKIVHEKSEGYNKKGCKIQLFYQNVDKKYEGL